MEDQNGRDHTGETDREDRRQFVLDNQRAFRYGAMEEFGERDSHFEEDGEIISASTIENCIDSGTAYRIMDGGTPVGGLVLNISQLLMTEVTSLYLPGGSRL